MHSLFSFYFIIASLLFQGWTDRLSEMDNKAEQIIQKTIERHGGDRYEQLFLKFRFRKLRFEVTRQKGVFKFLRISQDSTGNLIRDILTNDSFTRLIDGEEVSLTEKKSNSIQNGVNSVVYFALLPYKLNDPAAIKTYKGETIIKDEPYHVIEVSFKQEGGGDDYEDVFFYWIHTEDYTMDYLAYRFHIDGGGIRFRNAYEVKEIQGIRFQNYVNYKVDDMTVPMKTLPEMWVKGELTELSKIDLEDISLNLLTGKKSEQ